MADDVRSTYRGWQGHFIGDCRWHLNTLLEHGDAKVVVSTVGQYVSPGTPNAWAEIGLNRRYETMCFHADPGSAWHDIDVSRELAAFFAGYTDERAAQDGHLAMVERVAAWLREGGDG